MVGGICQLADGVHERDALGERTGAKVGARPAEQHPPVFDARGLVELLRRDRLGHASKGTVGMPAGGHAGNRGGWLGRAA